MYKMYSDDCRVCDSFENGHCALEECKRPIFETKDSVKKKNPNVYSISLEENYSLKEKLSLETEVLLKDFFQRSKDASRLTKARKEIEILINSNISDVEFTRKRREIIMAHL